MDLCVICKESLHNGDATVTLQEKGTQGVNAASQRRGDAIETSAGQTVHTECRRKYCHPQLIEQDVARARGRERQSQSASRSLRSGGHGFSFNEDCLFCGHPVRVSGRKRSFEEVPTFPVRTGDFQETVNRTCLERGDEWANQVKARIEYGGDLHAQDAVYHQVCSINFRTGKQVPSAYKPRENVTPTRGRPANMSRDQGFLKVTAFLKETEDEQVTISDLVQHMADYCEPYTAKYMNRRIKEHFGENVIITSVCGKSNIVTLRATAAAILDDFYKTPKGNDAEAEKIRIIETAADLILSDIKSVTQSKATYPTTEDIASVARNGDFIPTSLRVMLKKLCREKQADLKSASIGQAIMQAACPRGLLAPLQIGLAVQLHHHFASRFLIESLHSHGFCCSYTEVQRFEVCAASSQGTSIPGVTPGHFVQYMADNVDHNICTLDGLKTFHGMGIIAAVTPATYQSMPVPRDTQLSTKDLAVKGKINIHFFKQNPNASTLVYHDQEKVECTDELEDLDLMWKIMWPLRSPRPSWSGMMQSICHGSYPGQSSVTFLPMIDMTPSDMSCVYSTLKFVCAEAQRHEVTPVITFDQPLWYKAQTVIANEPAASDLHTVVLRLGGFHTQMSFLGCVGHLMSNSGLQEVLEIVYAPNAVSHMLSGKAVTRAVRGHFLIDSALNALITAKAFGVVLPHHQEHGDASACETLSQQHDPMEVNEASIRAEPDGSQADPDWHGADPDWHGADPDRPVADADLPVADPDLPVADPNRPVADPNMPRVDPNRTGINTDMRGEDSDADPDVPGINPDRRGADPDRPGTDPDMPVEDPDWPGADPDRSGTDPDMPVEDPDWPGADPDRPGVDIDRPGADDDRPRAEPLDNDLQTLWTCTNK